MCDKDRLLDCLNSAKHAKLNAETQLLVEKAKQVKATTTRSNLDFVLRWALVGLVLGGVVKLDLVKGVAKWMIG
jgi:hypothetical protein